MSRPAVFLDRDGTLIDERGYVDRLDLIAVFPWTGEALRLLNRAGFATVVITNQSGVGRGIIRDEFLHEVHRELDRRFAPARIDRYYYCPHHPAAEIEQYREVCGCRKPLAGLIDRACGEMDLDPAQSFMIGDRWLDVQSGRAAGKKAILLKTGRGAHEAPTPPVGVTADAILNNLMEAVGWILRNSSPSSTR